MVLGPDDRRAEIRFSAEAQVYSLAHGVETGSEANTNSSPMSGGYFRRGKATGA
jgi:hypothetical protein